MNDTPPFTYPDPYQSESSDQKKEKSFAEPAHTIYAEAAEDETPGPSPFKFAVGVLILLLLVTGTIGFFAWIGGDDGESTTPGVDEEVVNTKHVQAGEAVVLRTEDGAELIVPEGAVSQDTVIAITRVAPGYLTARYKLIPDGFEFAKPVTVRIPYNESVLQNAQTVRLNVWNDGAARKTVSYRIDTTDKKLETSLMQF